MNKKWDEKVPMLTFVKGLRKQETAIFPLCKTSLNLRLNLSTTSLLMQRKYSSHINRDDNTVEVTRVQ